MSASRLPDPLFKARYRASLLFFAIGLLLSVVAVNFQFWSIPVRAFFVVIALGIALLGSPSRSVDAVNRNQTLFLLIGSCAAIGAVVSLANGEDMKAVFRQLIEIHGQAVAGLMLAAILIRQMGIKPVAVLFVTCWSISAIFAFAQFLDIQIAWQVRSLLGDLMQDPEITRHFYDQKQRALGLSFSPVHLATQTCLAFAAFFALRIYATSGSVLQRLDIPTCLAVGLAMLVCVVSGNRSPLLGFTLFIIIYCLAVAPRLFVISLPFLMLGSFGGLVLFDLMAAAGLRVASFEDGSAIGRATLARFGMQLLWDQPLGYGLLFESTVFSDRYAHRAIHLDNADIIHHFSLHNYYLQMLNKYGVLILALVPLLIPGRKRLWWGWTAFLPYLIHIAFHNDGPLSSDFLFWFVLPLFPVALAAIPKPAVEQQKPRKWTRSYRRQHGLAGGDARISAL